MKPGRKRSQNGLYLFCFAIKTTTVELGAYLFFKLEITVVQETTVKLRTCFGISLGDLEGTTCIRRSQYWFPVAAVTKYCNLSGFR